MKRESTSWARATRLPTTFAGVISYLEAGRFPVDAVITHVVPFAEAGAALTMWANDPGTVTKIVVDLGGS